MVEPQAARAIDPAVAEVGVLSDFPVAIAPLKTDRSVTHVALHWRRKEDEAAVDRALQFSKVRLHDAARGPGGRSRQCPVGVAGRTRAALCTETARMRHAGFDIFIVQGKWQARTAGESVSLDLGRAFLAFFRKSAKADPP